MKTRTCSACVLPFPETPLHFRQNPYTGVFRGTCRTCERELAAGRYAERAGNVPVPDWSRGILYARVTCRFGKTGVTPQDVFAASLLQDGMCALSGARMILPPEGHNGCNWNAWAGSLPADRQTCVAEPARVYSDQPWSSGNIVLVCRGLAGFCEASGGVLAARERLQGGELPVLPSPDRVAAALEYHADRLAEEKLNRKSKRKRKP